MLRRHRRALGGGRFRAQSLITGRIGLDRLPVTFAAPHHALQGFGQWGIMMDIETLTYEMDGVSAVVNAIGSGPAVLALHGAATLEGYPFARVHAGRFRGLFPFHPGFGESTDAPRVAGLPDIVMRFLNLGDAMGLTKPYLRGLRWMLDGGASRRHGWQRRRQTGAERACRAESPPPSAN